LLAEHQCLKLMVTLFADVLENRHEENSTKKVTISI
jgi:hypothetical protein